MPNWCYNSIAFYQSDGGNDMLDAFYADIRKYQDHKESETGGSSDWVGHWLKSNRFDVDTIYSRGFFIDCELCGDHVRVDMETAWAPLPEVYDIMAEKYGLSYVYIAEESGCEIYINTDSTGRFFTTRYMLNGFDVDDLGLDAEILLEYGECLREISRDSRYYDSLDEVMNEFNGFGFVANDLNHLNECLDKFYIRVYEYSNE